MIIYSTFAKKIDAKNITKKLLEEKLIKCANILPKAESFYLWQNKIETTEEIIVIFKTNTKNYKEAVLRIEELHPYQTACVMAIEPKIINENFLNWLNET